MGQISQVFGKESGLKRSDLERIIIENELVESVTIEYKGIGNKLELDDALTEAILIQPLVSFLNTIDRQGSLLILGVNAKKHVPSDIDPIPESLLTAERVTSLVNAYIGSIPGLPNPPNMKIVPVKCGSKGAVLLIELETWPAGAYYSRLTNLSYVREGDTSRKLSLPDFLQLSRRLSGSAASLEVDRAECKVDEKSGQATYSIRLVCTNRGNRPGVHVGGFFGVNRSAARPLISVIVPAEFADVSHLNPAWERMLSFVMKLEGGGPVYPGARIVIDGLQIVTPRRQQLDVNVETNDGDGKTVRDFRITPTGKVRATSYRRVPWGFA